jgi:hypothetical protein
MPCISLLPRNRIRRDSYPRIHAALVCGRTRRTCPLEGEGACSQAPSLLGLFKQYAAHRYVVCAAFCFAPLRAFFLMNCSTASKASSSRSCFGGDFIR